MILQGRPAVLVLPGGQGFSPAMAASAVIARRYNNSRKLPRVSPCRLPPLRATIPHAPQRALIIIGDS